MSQIQVSLYLHPLPTNFSLGLICDLLWSDPADGDIKGWEENERGVSYVFGDDIVKIFNDTNQLDLICRAH